MAEIFKNFMSKTNSAGIEKVIVPSGTINNNKSNIADDTSFGENFREEDSTVQVHSLYISQAFETRVKGTNRCNEDNFRNFDIYIKDDNKPQLLIYVAHAVQLVPGCPYYIEKNITLTPSQKLCLTLPNVAPNTNGGLNVHVVASAIIFTDDIEE